MINDTGKTLFGWSIDKNVNDFEPSAIKIL
jgi:hypothetical protein